MTANIQIFINFFKGILLSKYLMTHFWQKYVWTLDILNTSYYKIKKMTWYDKQMNQQNINIFSMSSKYIANYPFFMMCSTENSEHHRAKWGLLYAVHMRLIFWGATMGNMGPMGAVTLCPLVKGTEWTDLCSFWNWLVTFSTWFCSEHCKLKFFKTTGRVIQVKYFTNYIWWLNSRIYLSLTEN